MNATQPNEKATAKTTTRSNENTLRVLSDNQNAQVKSVAKDWQKFSFGVFSKMFDKI